MRPCTNWERIPLIMTTAQAGKILGCTARTVRNYINSGLLKAVRPTPKGGVLKVTKESLMNFLEVTS